MNRFGGKSFFFHRIQMTAGREIREYLKLSVIELVTFVDDLKSLCECNTDANFNKTSRQLLSYFGKNVHLRVCRSNTTIRCWLIAIECTQQQIIVATLFSRFYQRHIKRNTRLL